MEKVATSSEGIKSAFYDELKTKANEAVQEIFKGTISSIQLGGHGDFNYFWQNSDGRFNNNTFNFISSRIAPGDNGSVQLVSPFQNDYDNVLNSLVYMLSSDDQTMLNKTTTKASSQAGAIVSQYETNLGNIANDDLNKAADVLGYTPGKIDYVIEYAMGYLWSGVEKSNQRVTLTEMQNARHLSDLFPKTPPRGAGLIDLVSNYLSILGSTVGLQDAVSNGKWLINQLRKNTENPTDSNGGMITIDNQGKLTTHVGYVINKAVTDIMNDLQNTGRKIEIKMNVNQVSQDEVNVSMEGSAGISGAIDFFELRASGGAKTNIYSFKGTGTDVTVDMSYDGYSIVPVSLANFTEDTLAGWFYGVPIASANANATKDTTGYHFQPTPPFDFNNGGTFGRLNAILISNYPTVTITYTHGEYNTFKESFEEHSSWSVDFLGIPIGHFEQSLYQSSLRVDDKTGSFSITFTPSKEVLSVPDFQKTAYVLGGSVSYSGAMSMPILDTTALINVTKIRVSSATGGQNVLWGNNGTYQDDGSSQHLFVKSPYQQYAPLVEGQTYFVTTAEKVVNKIQYIGQWSDGTYVFSGRKIGSLD